MATQEYKSIPQEKLDQKLDFGHGNVPLHLGKIASSIDEWEGRVSDELMLTTADVASIKTEHPTKLNLQVRAALQKWQEKLGPKATYRNLIRAFEKADKKNYAETVRMLLKSPDSDHDSNTCGVIQLPPTTVTTHESDGINVQAVDKIKKWCCVFENDNGIQGSGVITKFTGVETLDELSKVLPGLKKADGKIETLWAIFTCHHIMPGDCLTGWKIHCCIKGEEVIHEVEKVISGVVSCCASQSVIGPGSSSVAKDPHLGKTCSIELDFTILFCNHQFVNLYNDDVPPAVSISVTYEVNLTSKTPTSGEVYFMDQEKLQVHVGTVIDENDTDTAIDCSRTRLRHQIKAFRENLRSIRYSCTTPSFSTQLFGAPIVVCSSNSKHQELVGLTVGKDTRSLVVSPNISYYHGNTIFGIIQLLKGNPVALFATLQNYEARRLSAHRWNYLLLPYLKGHHKYELIHLLDLLDLLSEKSDVMDRLLSLCPTEERDARLATLDLLIALFKHFGGYDNATVLKTVNSEGDDFDKRIEKHLKHILWGINTALMSASETNCPDKVAIEKYINCYSTVLTFKHGLIREHIMLGKKQETFILVKEIAQKCKTLHQIQSCAAEIEQTFASLSQSTSDDNSQDHSTRVNETVTVQIMPPQKITAAFTSLVPCLVMPPPVHFVINVFNATSSISQKDEELKQENKDLKRQLSVQSDGYERLRRENEQLLAKMDQLKGQHQVAAESSCSPPNTPIDYASDVLRENHQELRQSLNFHTIWPLLNKHSLLPKEQRQLTSSTIETQIDFLICHLPKCGTPNYLECFIECLRKTADEAGDAHLELAGILESEYKLKIQAGTSNQQSLCRPNADHKAETHSVKHIESEGPPPAKRGRHSGTPTE